MRSDVYVAKKNKGEDIMKIYATKLGMAGGILWGVSLFCMTILCTYTGYGKPILDLIVAVYPGYEITLLGSLIGLVYGFIDCFLFFFLLAWLYNKMVSCCSSSCCKKD
jgi:hypothetical protein